jgi:signal transduction histidine kinase
METEAATVAKPVHPPRRVPAWLGDMIAMLLLAVAAFAHFPNQEFRPANSLVLVVVLAPVLLLPFRRHWPIAVLAACVALYGAAALAGTLSPGLALATAITMFTLADRSSRRVTLISAVGAIAGLGLLSLLAALGTVFDPRAIQYVVSVAFAAALGDATRSRRESIRTITERAERAEQTRDSEAKRQVAEERLRIARDLHDAVAHQIAVISLNAGVASSALDTRPESAKQALGVIRTAARTVLGEIGNLLEMLRADEETSAGSRTAPLPGLDRLDDLVREFAGSNLEVTLRREGELARLPRALDSVAYRVIQEGLTNAHKHGAEHRAHVLVSVGEDAVRIVITNPVAPPAPGTGSGEGEGTSASAGAVKTRGHGVLGLRERVASVRGTIDTGEVAGGYQMSARLPLVLESSP